MKDIIAGIMLGYVNQAWIAVLLASLGWGIVGWSIGLISGRRAGYVAWSHEVHPEKKHPDFNFFLIEYLTSFVTSLIFGVITYFIKGL